MAQDTLFAGIFLLVILAISLAFTVLMVASIWKLFTTAGEPGWAARIPIYDLYIMMKIGNNPAWYLLLLFIPFVNIYISVEIHIDLAKAYGEGLGMGLGLAFLPIIFFPLLAFGDYPYTGGSGNAGAGAGRRLIVTNRMPTPNRLFRPTARMSRCH